MAEEKYKDPNVYGEEPKREVERPITERPSMEKPITPAYAEPARTPMPAREMALGYEGIRWGPIFGGLFIALAAQAIFMTLGVAIGLSSAAAVGTTGITAGAGIWAAISGILAFFLGGYVASRTSLTPSSFTGALIGLVVFSLALVLGLLFSGLSAAGFLVALASFLGPAAPSIVPTPGQPGLVLALTGGTAWWFFVWMVLGSIAAALGGVVGAPRRVVTRT